MKYLLCLFVLVFFVIKHFKKIVSLIVGLVIIAIFYAVFVLPAEEEQAVEEGYKTSEQVVTTEQFLTTSGELIVSPKYKEERKKIVNGVAKFGKKIVDDEAQRIAMRTRYFEHMRYVTEHPERYPMTFKRILEYRVDIRQMSQTEADSIYMYYLNNPRSILNELPLPARQYEDAYTKLSKEDKERFLALH